MKQSQAYRANRRVRRQTLVAETGPGTASDSRSAEWNMRCGALAARRRTMAKGSRERGLDAEQ